MRKLSYDFNKCLGCRSCEFECATAHSNESRRKVVFTKDKHQHVYCHHCPKPKCVDACVASALVFDKEQSMVLYDQTRCVSCWQCVAACPFGAIWPNLANSLLLRCDLCKDKESPACVDACPTKAIGCKL